MVTCDVRKIDAAGRILLPSNLKLMTAIEKGDRVKLQSVGELVILHTMDAPPNEGYQGIKVDKLSKVKIPKELLKKMGWKRRDKIVIYNVSDDILAFEKKIDYPTA